MTIRLIKTIRTRIRIADVDMDRMSFPIHTGTTRLAFEDGEDAFVGGASFGFVAEGGECVATLKESRAHAELRDADGEKFEGGGVGEAWGGGIFFVLWVEDWIVFGLIDGLNRVGIGFSEEKDELRQTVR